jgi:hypothetical protein
MRNLLPYTQNRIREVEMIRVTAEAADALAEAMEKSGVTPEQGLRLKSSDELEFVLGIDWPTEEDRIIKHGDTNLVIVDQTEEQAMGDLLIDLQEGPDGIDVVVKKDTPGL